MPATQLSTYLQNRSRLDEIKDSMYDAQYQTAIASVALSRYLCCENVNELGPSLLSQVLEVHDFPLLLVPLIEEPPWTRRRSVEKRGISSTSTSSTSSTNNNNKNDMVWEKLDEQNEWKQVVSSELLRVTQLEGQPWLALYSLTTSKTFRESYGLDEYRKSQLMKVRKYIHESILDQLPVLGEVARYLDELSILGVPPAGQGVHRPSSNASSSGLLLQRVDVLRESIVGGKRSNMTNDQYWQKVADTQWDEIFSRVTDAKDEALRRIASEVYGGEGGGGMVDVMDESVMATSLANDNVASASHVHVDQNNNQKKEEDVPQSTEAALSTKSIEKVVLTMSDGGSKNSLASYELIPVRNGAGDTITDTPHGPFQRIKLSVSQTSGDGEAVMPIANVTACTSFASDDEESSYEQVTLSLDSLALPTVEHTTSQNSYDEVGIELPETFSSKVWTQIGDKDGKGIVLQVGFKRLDRGVVPAGETLLRGYYLSQAFVSQPLKG